MDKSGLVALAETYGLDRRELQRLKLLAESFFEELRDRLADSIGTAIRLSGLVQSISTFKDVCAGTSDSQFIFLGTGHKVAALIKTDAAFARALVDCLISGKTSEQPTALPLTAVEEYLLANSMTAACTRAASRALAAQLGYSGELRRIEPAGADSITQSEEQQVRARIVCQIGGGAGALELALPSSRISKTATHPLPAQSPDSVPAETKARMRLPEAEAELVAVMGQIMMPLDAVRALGPGSILTLKAFKGGVPGVELHCGDQVLFSGAVVEHRGWRRFLIQQTGVSDERTEQPRAGA